MPAFSMKYGDKIRLLLVLISFSILVIELSLLTVWSRGTKQESDSETTVLPSKNVTVENGKRLTTTKDVQIKKRDEFKPMNASTKVKQVPKREKVEKDDVDTQIQKLLSPFVNDSLGRVLNIEFKTIKLAKGQKDSTDTLDIVYRKSKHGVNVLEPKIELLQPLARRYVYVYERYWEQLTMNTRVLMALASQARLGGRFVVEPKVKDSVFGDTGYPFSTYYNVTQMNALLKSNGFSTFVTENEFDTECSVNNDQFHAIVHFLYEDDKAVSYLKNKFGITTQQYDEISRRAKKNGWTDCKLLKPYSSPGLKVFCVDPIVVSEWSVLERGILQDIKCLGIFAWRGIGFKTRTSFGEKHVKVSSKEIHFLLEPSLAILNEAEIFTKTHLSGAGYVAVQVRGEKVVIQNNLTRLKKCLRLLVNVIKNTKKYFGISKVFVATDMSDFGSGSWAGGLKTKNLDTHALKIVHSNLITRIGAVVYKPSADWQTPDRGAVSLVELSIIAHAQHLLTIGTGSFQEWAVAKFLEFHRDDDPKLWSLTRFCSLP